MTQRKTDVNGWYEVKRNPLSRVGVFPYSGASCGKPEMPVVRVLRPEEELADPECVESFKLLPWVDDHTMLGDPDSGLMPAEVKGVQGVIGEEVFYDSGVLYGNIKVFSEALQRLIEAGKKQLSAGYRCVYDWSAGVHNGQAYDCVQRAIRGNHLALVSEGRMGPSVAVMDRLTFSFDAKDAIMAKDDGATGGAGGGEMTLPELAKLVQAIGPQLAAINEALAGIGKPGTAAAAGDDPDPAVAQAASAAMDAAIKPLREQVTGLAATVAAMDAAVKGIPAPATIYSEISARDKLADRLAAVVGTFDAKDKTLQGVAEYGCAQLKLTPAMKGAELVAVDAYLTAAEARPVQTVRAAQDSAPSADNFVSKHLAGKSGAAVK